jgi:hypothetical protein
MKKELEKGAKPRFPEEGQKGNTLILQSGKM